MAYLFKDSIKERVEESTIYVSDRVFNELDEVYRKAKAFDEIAITVLQESDINTQQMNNEVTQIVIKSLKESADDER